MKIAVFLRSEALDTLDEHIVHAIILSITDNIVTGIDKEFLSTENIDHIGLWLVTRRINMLYLQIPDEKTKTYLEKIGIGVNSFEDLKNNELIKLFDLF